MKRKSSNKKNVIDPVTCVWGLLCRFSAVDQERNNISLFDIVEQFNITPNSFKKAKEEKKELVVSFAYEIVLLLRRTLDVSISSEEILMDLKVQTIDPTGKVLQEILSPLNFPRAIKRLRFRLPMQYLPVTLAGDYVHKIYLKAGNQNDFKEALEIPFEVKEQILLKKQFI